MNKVKCSAFYHNIGKWRMRFFIFFVTVVIGQCDMPCVQFMDKRNTHNNRKNKKKQTHDFNKLELISKFVKFCHYIILYCIKVRVKWQLKIHFSKVINLHFYQTSQIIYKVLAFIREIFISLLLLNFLQLYVVWDPPWGCLTT